MAENFLYGRLDLHYGRSCSNRISEFASLLETSHPDVHVSRINE